MINEYLASYIKMMLSIKQDTILDVIDEIIDKESETYLTGISRGIELCIEWISQNTIKEEDENDVQQKDMDT